MGLLKLVSTLKIGEFMVCKLYHNKAFENKSTAAKGQLSAGGGGKGREGFRRESLS